MNVSNISFGKVLYSYKAKNIIPSKQLDYLDKISTATGTDIIISPKDSPEGKNSATIILDSKTGVIIEEKGNVELGEILSRVYNNMLVRNTDILTARNIVNYEILNPSQKNQESDLEKIGKIMLESIYRYMAESGLTVSNESSKLQKKKLRTISNETLAKDYPHLKAKKDKLEAERTEIEQLCKDKGISLKTSTCKTYDDIY